MDNKQILKIYNKTKSIYGFMYGTPILNYGDHYRLDEIVEIPKSKLQLNKNKDALIYVWGWPGPDFNIYKFEDYGKTWVFSDKEFKNVIKDK